ncbi:MAG TPA: hypothetical protein VMH30_03515 [Verrucomicrobiae bacterium]|nr:hypothetical protein [Verrucomicrobiae bacterium]
MPDCYGHPEYFLTCAAILGVDTCPIGAIEPDKYDALLNLGSRHLSTVVACAAGHRAKNDMYASLKKVRFPKEQVFLELEAEFTPSPENWRTGATQPSTSAELRKV